MKLINLSILKLEILIFFLIYIIFIESLNLFKIKNFKIILNSNIDYFYLNKK
jgi:hypothetical protein